MTKYRVIYPEYVKPFANWLLSLNREDLTINRFNGFSQDKEFKTLEELFDEWYENYSLMLNRKIKIGRINEDQY